MRRTYPNTRLPFGGLTVYLGFLLVLGHVDRAEALPKETPPPKLSQHITAIASFAKASPLVEIPAGWFLMGTNRVDNNPFGLETQYDNTEFPQRRIWLDTYQMDRYEVTLGEFLAHMHHQQQPVSTELRHLIWHLISVHFIPDQVLAPWPALYVTWEEAAGFCLAQGRQLPTEAQWEKAARGTEGHVFPWGLSAPRDDLAVFGQYHVHEIPLVAAVDGWEEGRSPFGLHHMAGNVAEWVQDWSGFDYYPMSPNRNPQGPKKGRYKVVRGGSWKSRPQMLRTATRGGAFPDQRAATIGFRCAQNATRSSP